MAESSVFFLKKKCIFTQNQKEITNISFLLSLKKFDCESLKMIA